MQTLLSEKCAKDVHRYTEQSQIPSKELIIFEIQCTVLGLIPVIQNYYRLCNLSRVKKTSTKNWCQYPYCNKTFCQLLCNVMCIYFTFTWTTYSHTCTGQDMFCLYWYSLPYGINHCMSPSLLLIIRWL